MKYIADLLTLSRFVLAGMTIALLFQDRWSLAAISFGIGLLTDAFDGIAARRWPYDSEGGSVSWWRKDPHAFDNAADFSLCAAGMVGLSMSLLPFIQAVAILIGAAGVSVMFLHHISIMIEESRFGDAEKTDVMHGFVYGAEMVAMLVIMTVLATPAWPAILVAYAVVGLPLLWIKRDRLMSRPEVDYGRT